MACGEPDPVAVPLAPEAPSALPLGVRVELPLAVPEGLAEGVGVGVTGPVAVSEGVPLAEAPAEMVAEGVPVAVGVNELSDGGAQRPPIQERPSEHTGRNARRVQCAPTAGHVLVTNAPPTLINKAAPLLLTVKAASAAHAAALAPWQARLCGLHEYPSLHSVAARGTTNEELP